MTHTRTFHTRWSTVSVLLPREMDKFSYMRVVLFFFFLNCVRKISFGRERKLNRASVCVCGPCVCIHFRLLRGALVVIIIIVYNQ